MHRQDFSAPPELQSQAFKTLQVLSAPDLGFPGFPLCVLGYFLCAHRDRIYMYQTLPNATLFFFHVFSASPMSALFYLPVFKLTGLLIEVVREPDPCSDP